MSHSIHSIIAMLDYAQLTCTFYVLPVHCALSYTLETSDVVRPVPLGRDRSS